MIRRLIRVRKDAYASLECTKEDEGYSDYAALIMQDRFLGLLALWYIGSIFLLVVAILGSSLEAFGGFLLSIATCTLVSWPLVRNYLARFCVYSDT